MSELETQMARRTGSLFPHPKPSAYGLGERDMRIDAMITTPHASNHVRSASLIDVSRLEAGKHLNYGKIYRAYDIKCMPFDMDGYGALGESAKKFFPLRSNFSAHRCGSAPIPNILSYHGACLHRMQGRKIVVRALTS